MKNLILILSITTLFFSCKNDDHKSEQTIVTKLKKSSFKNIGMNDTIILDRINIELRKENK